MILFWVAALALATLLYVVLDGFDLGVGILFGFTASEDIRHKMLATISPVWDGNETWLIFTGTILWGAFPRVYATLLAAFYLPITFMLAALILRGVAFEFREKALGARWIWDWGFAGGSLVASVVQGVAVGALVAGLPMAQGHYAGGSFAWLGPFPLLCGVGMCLGHALLGASWLVLKGEDEMREKARRLLKPLAIGVFGFLAIAFVYALALDFRIMGRWVERPYLLICPIIGALAAYLLARGIGHRQDRQPFFMVVVIFIAAFATLGISFWPYMIPFAVTINEAASPPASLSFMFWGAGLFVLPLTLIYTAAVYFIFNGKVVDRSYD